MSLEPLAVVVTGNLASFTHCLTKAEPITYPCITPSAAIGVLRCIYWKPEMEWEIEEIGILKPIKKNIMKYNGVKEKGLKEINVGNTKTRTQICMEVLEDVSYYIKPKIIAKDDMLIKHISVYNRRVEKGILFKQPYLGRSGFLASVKKYENEQPIKLDIDGLIMPIDYIRNNNNLIIRYAKCWVKDGVLKINKDQYYTIKTK